MNLFSISNPTLIWQTWMVVMILSVLMTRVFFKLRDLGHLHDILNNYTPNNLPPWDHLEPSIAGKTWSCWAHWFELPAGLSMLTNIRDARRNCLIVRRLCADFRPNCSLSVKSVKFSGLLDFVVMNKMWYSAISNFEPKSRFWDVFKMAAILENGRHFEMCFNCLIFI